MPRKEIAAAARRIEVVASRLEVAGSWIAVAGCKREAVVTMPVYSGRLGARLRVITVTVREPTQ